MHDLEIRIVALDDISEDAILIKLSWIEANTLKYWFSNLTKFLFLFLVSLQKKREHKIAS